MLELIRTINHPNGTVQRTFRNMDTGLEIISIDDTYWAEGRDGYYSPIPTMTDKELQSRLVSA